MQEVFLVLHLLICMVLVGAVLMQRSEGGALGMGGGGAGSLISGRGAADMMVNITSWVGGAFFVTSLVLAILAGARPAERSVIEDEAARKGGINFTIPGLPGSRPAEAPAVPVAPAAPVGAPDVEGGTLAPAPQNAVTRAGPLATSGSAPAPAAEPAAPPAPRAPIGAAPARPSTGAPKAAGAPMIPLPSAAPAPSTESAQPAAPAPQPARDRSGPDE